MLPFMTNFVAPDGTLLTAFNPGFEDVQQFMQVFGNAAVASGSGGGLADCVAWGGDVFLPDHFAEVVLGLVGSEFKGVAVRCGAAGSGDLYSYFGNSSGSYLQKWIGGAATVLAAGAAFPDGAHIRMEAVGNVITPLLNGVSDIAPATDSSLAAGRGGLSSYSSGAVDSPAVSFTTGNLGGASGPTLWPMGMS